MLRSALFSRLEWKLFLLAFVTYAYFQGEIGWNQAARFEPVFSFVEAGPDHGTFHIDHFIRREGWYTADWAAYGGHYYSNKAPGSTWLGVPVYWALHRFDRWRGAKWDEKPQRLWNIYWLNLWVGVFWSAIGGVALFRFLRRARGLSAADAWPLVWIYGFATLVFPFSTSYWGHPTAAAFLLLAYLALWEERTWAGALWLGAAITTEYACALSLPLAFALVYGRSRSARARAAFVGALMAGIFPLLLFQRVCFGAWLATSTQYANPEQLDPHRALGLFGHLNFHALFMLLLSPGRGIFVYLPVLLSAVFFGVGELWRERRYWLLGICGAHALLFLLLIASFNGWHGGATSGPRYLIASLPFWCAALPAFSKLRPWPRRFTVFAAALSTLNMLVIAGSTTMAKLNPSASVLYGWLYPYFFHAWYDEVGTFPHWVAGVKMPYATFPLLLFWAVMAIAIGRETRAARA